MKDKIQVEKDKKEELIRGKRTLEQDVSSIRGDLSDVEIQVQKVEQERTNKDHHIRTLNDDITGKDELINKLNKELLAGLAVDLLNVLLFLIELVDELIFASNVIIESPDVMIFVGSLLLHLRHLDLHIREISPDTAHVLLQCSLPSDQFFLLVLLHLDLVLH